MIKSRLRPLVSVWFQVLFTPLLAVLFTFPSQYLFTIGLSVVFSLTRWCWYIQTEFHRLRPTHYSSYMPFVYRTITSFGLPSQVILLTHIWLLGSSAFARHYLRNNYCYLFLRVLRCFSSPGYPPPKRILYLQYSGLPHSDIHGSIACLQLPMAFRSLPRPSSSPRA